MRRLSILVLAASVALTWWSASAAVAQGNDCADFSSQQEAQQFFIDHGGPDSDPFGLDPDEDGVACETLPAAPATPATPSTASPSPTPSTSATPEPAATPEPLIVPVSQPRPTLRPVVQHPLPTSGRNVERYGGAGLILFGLGLALVTLSRRRVRPVPVEQTPWDDDPLIGW